MTRTTALLTLSTVLVMAGACSSDPIEDPVADAGGESDAGTAPVDDAGTEADAGTGQDAGAEPDAGTLPDAGTGGGPVELDLETSCPHTPCGGSIPDGVYRYTAGCVVNYFADLSQLCASATITTTKASVDGTLTFSNGNEVDRDVRVRAEGTAFVPSSCLFGGTCQQASTLISSYFPGSTCTSATGGCDCALLLERTVTDSSSYTVSGNQLLAGTRTYDFCVSGATLTYEDVSAGNERQPGVYTLER